MALAAAFAGIFLTSAASAQLSVGSYHLQSSSRVSLYEYDYTYTADVVNDAVQKQGVTGTVTSNSPQTAVTKSTVQFGSVPSGATVTSVDTFTIRQDRRAAFSPSSLQWSFQGQPVLEPGKIATTPNPQVALYTVNLPTAGSVVVNFGTDTSYGRQTWIQSRSDAGPIAMQVAGMLANTTYHLQAVATLADGTSIADADHTFTTGAPVNVPKITAAATPGMTPQPGVEQLTFVTLPLLGVAVTDLQGRPIWTYQFTPNNIGSVIEGAKLMPNGHFILSIGEGSTFPLQHKTNPAGVVVALREVDLAGNTVQELPIAELNRRMHGAGYNLNLLELHHEVTPLPNGHLLVLSNTIRTFTDLPGYPGKLDVIADTVVDLDKNLNPVWVWDEFDHLDVNRHPFSFPDLTHTNAITYSPTDGNIFVSMRHQNWVVKVDYRNGAGTGGILWRLGYQGDLTLRNGLDPVDWQYAQHMPTLFTPQSAGVFSLGMMDNGDDRVFSPGVQCDVQGSPACHYSTIPVYEIDEAAKTATLVFHQILPTNLYSYFGGNVDKLANGNVEYDLSSTSPTTDSDVFEVTQTDNPQTVWHMHTSGANVYRGFRIPSLYPGVLWN
ncbi:aryl-sulfate sulfotransferase [Terriglobus sp.]|uniref:aryl-sulfate sulfotransferase n=1 Tax=Terriglobus sp. TaxID=1889013 RepID=UPI003B004BD2